MKNKLRKAPGDDIRNMERPKGVTDRSNLETVLMYYRGQIEEKEMTENERKYLFAMRCAYGMLIEALPNPQIVGALIKDHKFSQASAYRLIASAQQVYGNLKQADKDFARFQAIEMAKYAWSLAKRREDMKGLNQALKNFILATGIDKLDPDLPDFEKLAPSINVLQLPEGLEESVMALLKQGAVNLNSTTIEIPYEDVTNQPGGASTE